MAFKNAWDGHPAVPTGPELSFRDRAVDGMKRGMATWTCLLGFLALMVVWIVTGGFGTDHEPFQGLNLVLSGIAGLQCFVLLLAAKRSDQISALLAQHAFETGEKDFLVDQQALVLLGKIADKVGAESEESGCEQ